MSDTEKYLLGEGVDCTKVHTVSRKAGAREYELKYRELNGDDYESILYTSRERAYDDEVKRQKLLSEMLREKMLVSVAGAEYKATLDRKLPVWLMADVNEFVISYISGNL